MWQGIAGWLSQSPAMLLPLLNTPVQSAMDPSRRTYWVFLIAAIAIAIVVLALQQGAFYWRRWLRTFFSRQYFLSRSSATDIGYWFFNALLKLAVIVPLMGGHLVFTLFVVRFLHHNIGPAPDIDGQWMAIPWVMMTIYTLVFLITEDASRYGLHRLMHQVPWLWRLHKVHHSAKVLTPFTLYRVHPVEMALYYFRGTLVFGLVSGIFIYLWGAKVSGWHILGVDAVGFLFNLAAANLRHSHIWLSFGFLERWFISPAQHQLHHSNNPRHFNQNYGAILAVWDRCFGSWRQAGKRQTLNFGIE